jgi:hypothetical protein
LEIEHELRERGIVGRDDHAAFVEERERVAFRPAALRLGLAALLEDGDVLRVDGGLGPRKRHPRQRVEQIVPVLRPGLDLAGARDARLVIAACRIGVLARRDEAKRHPARGRQARGQRVELLVRGPAIARQPRQRRAQRIEDRGVEPG